MMAEDLMMAVKLKSLMMKAKMITTHHIKKKAEDLMMAVKLKSLMMKATMITTHHIKKKAEDLTTEDLMTTEGLKTRKKEIMNQAWRAWSATTTNHENIMILLETGLLSRCSLLILTSLA